MPGARDATVHKLTAHGYQDFGVFERRVQRDLIHADVHPSWLSEEAILYIRHVRLTEKGPLGDALKAFLESLRPLAIRPVWQDAGSAEAVLFANEAERLACFTLDWLDDAVPSRWWWRQGSPQTYRDDSPAHLWIAHARYAPAAMFLLNRKGIGAKVLARFTPHARLALLRALEREFQLSLNLPGFGQGEVVNSGATLDRTFDKPNDDTRADQTLDFPAFHPDERESRLLLHLLLLLVRSPALARSPVFRQIVNEWWSETRNQSLKGPPTESKSLTGDVLSGVEVPTVELTELVRQETPDPTRESDQLRTHLGGVFYLVNLAIFLELYGDFTVPVEDWNLPSIWRFVEWLGRELWQREDRMPDPIWALLRELAGEDIHEVPLVWNLPSIRARLTEALDIPEEDLGSFILPREARVRITLTHLSVYYSLSELSVAIRRSGLDRDPGWVPSAGRFIRFYFD